MRLDVITSDMIFITQMNVSYKNLMMHCFQIDCADEKQRNQTLLINFTMPVLL